MQLLLRLIDRLCLWGAWAAALACLALSGMLIVEISAIALFKVSQRYVVEYSAYLTGMVLFAGAGWALTEGAQIRVGLILHHLGDAARRWLDLVCALFGLWTVGMLCWGFIDLTYRSWMQGSRSSMSMQTPLVWPQGALTLCVLLLELALLARTLRLLCNLPVSKDLEEEVA